MRELIKMIVVLTVISLASGGLLAALRDRGARVPLILITAFDEPGLAQEATRRGAAAYLVKPFPGTTLLASVRAAIAAEAAP